MSLVVGDIMSDEELLKKVCEEMGIEWQQEAGYMIIEGIPASEWLKYNDIFS